MDMNQMKILAHTLASDLIVDINKVKNGQMDYKTASSVSKLSANAIKVFVNVDVTLQHQEIQFKKLAMRTRELDFKINRLTTTE